MHREPLGFSALWQIVEAPWNSLKSLAALMSWWEHEKPSAHCIDRKMADEDVEKMKQEVET